MACCLSNEDRCIHPDNVLQLNVVASVLLVGGRGHLFALPFIFVDLVPRVGGFGHKTFFQDRIADKGERLRACHTQGGAEPRVLRRMSSACPMPFKADGSGAVCTALAVCVETAT